MSVVSRTCSVAVVIPVYRARFLAAALESVFIQSRLPDEVIVVNDGSPDEADIAHVVARYGPRMRLITQSNQGAGAARNHGILAARSDLIALLDADDRWLPHFLREQLLAFEDDPRLDLCYTDGMYIGDTPLAGRSFMSTCPSDGPVTLERLLTQECTVLLSGVVCRRTAMLDAGLFDAAIRRGQDFDLWLRMARRGSRLAYRRQVLVLRREHGDNLSGDAISEIERPLTVLRKTVATMTLTEQEKAVAQRRIRSLELALARERGKALLRSGDLAAARRAFDEARNGLRSWKLQAARVGLRLAPHLVRRLYLARAASAAS